MGKIPSGVSMIGIQPGQGTHTHIIRNCILLKQLLSSLARISLFTFYAYQCHNLSVSTRPGSGTRAVVGCWQQVCASEQFLALVSGP